MNPQTPPNQLPPVGPDPNVVPAPQPQLQTQSQAPPAVQPTYAAQPVNSLPPQPQQIAPPQPSPTAPVVPPAQPVAPVNSPPPQPVPAQEVSYTPPTQPQTPAYTQQINEVPEQSSSQILAKASSKKTLSKLRSLFSLGVFLGGIVVTALLINQFIFQSYYVDGTSMVPTLKNNDRLIIDKVEHTFAQIQGKKYTPERGQIVVLDTAMQEASGQREQLIKRVIGLPGDVVTINNGTVTIKNAQSPDGFDVNKQLGLELAPTYVESPQEVTVPEGYVFVMGDNRAQNGSYDSRSFGAVELDNIVGRLWARILPLDAAKIF